MKKTVASDEFIKNEYTTNKVVGFFLLVFVIIGAANTVLLRINTDFDFIHVNDMIFIPLNSLIFAIVVFAWCFKFSRPWIKYILLGATMLITSIAFCIYTTYTIYLIFIPIFIASRYFDKRIIHVVSAITCIMFTINCTINILLDKSTPFFKALHSNSSYSPWSWHVDALVYIVFPCLLLMVFLSIFASNMTTSGRTLIETKIKNTEKIAAVKAEISMAANIQKSVLPCPHFISENGNFELFAYEAPAKDVCGDFYDYFMLDGNMLGIIVADVSDKGLSAAMFMMSAKKALKSAVTVCHTINDAVELANKMICADNEYGMFLTLWMGIIDTRSGVGKYVNAGHPFPIIRHENGVTEELTNEPNLFIGTFPEVTPSVNTFRMRKGDFLVIYTDGLTDSTNVSGESFGVERVIGGVREGKEVTELAKEFSSGATQFDDITVLTLTCHGTENARKIEKVVPATISGTGELNDFVLSEIKNAGFGDETRRSIGVVIDEICNNISEYAYQNGGDIGFSASIGTNYVEMEFCDGGVEFNPLSTENPQADGSLQIGGFGIYFVKNLCDAISYRYEDGKNKLTVLFIWEK